MKTPASIIAMFPIVLFSCVLVSLGDEPTGELAQYSALRTWSDLTGKFKIEGKLKLVDGEHVQIALANGKLTVIPLNKLSLADQSFVSEFQAKSAGDKSDNPFKEMSDTSPNSTNATPNLGTTPSGAADSFPLRTTSTKGAKQIVAKLGSPFWSASPPLGFPEVIFSDGTISTELRQRNCTMLSAGKAGVVVLNHHEEKNGSEFVVALASDESASPVVKFSDPWKLFSLSPDGSRAAAVRIEGWGKGNDVGIFQVTKAGLVPEFRFTAGGGAWDELHYVAFAPQNRLITISQKNTLTVWDLTDEKVVRAVYQGNSGGSLQASTSPAGELMALPAGSSIVVVDVRNAKIVGLINRVTAASQIHFSPNGKLIAAYSPFEVAFYSTSDGSEVRKLAHSNPNANASVVWVGDYLMVGDVLYDVERSLPVWTYESQGAQRSAIGSYLFCASTNDRSSAIAVEKIPHAEAVEAASRVDPEAIYALRPGDSVAVDYDLGEADANKQSGVTQAVEKLISSKGWKISPTASTRIAVQLIKGEQQTVEYETRHGAGPPISRFLGHPTGPLEKVLFTPWTHKVTITQNGAEVFKVQYYRGAPSGFQTKEGESTQDYVTRYCHPSPEYFENLAVPPNLLKKEYQGGLGKTVIKLTGL